MKLLMTGSNGMLGSSMLPILINKGFEVVTSNFLYSHMDIRNKFEVEETIKKVRPDIVLHLGAETDVDRCEREPNHAFEVNGLGTANIVDICKRYDILLLYVSTIGVFYGDKITPYCEYDEPHPANVYGWSKLLGEKYVTSNLKNYYIVRAGWMVGGGPSRDKKFVGKIIRQVKENKIIEAVTDKVGSPTYTVDFSNVVANLITTNKFGLYHCTNHGYPSRYDVACEVVDLMGRKVPVVPVDSSKFSNLSAGRANSEMSMNTNLQTIGLDSMRCWEEALKEYIEGYW